MSLILEKAPITNRNSNMFFRRKILSSYKNRVTPLDYNFISFSSQDPSHPINSLQHNQNLKTNEGWVSNRYCTYPQEIMIKFPTEVNIRQINILINESKIPKKIELINCIPIGKRNKFLMNSDKNVNLIPSEFMYENIGFINFSSNAENKYKLRELRKIYINVNTEYLKFKIHQNHNNNLNMFCQVGIVALNIYGQKRDKKLKMRKISPMREKNVTNISDDESLFEICFNGEGLDEKDIDEKLDTKTIEKIKELEKEMESKKQNEL
jgi:centrosomal protein CEP104